MNDALVAKLDLADVFRAHFRVHLYDGEIRGDEEERRLFARPDHLSHFDVARDYRSINRRNDLGTGEIDLCGMERRSTSSDRRLVLRCARLSLFIGGVRIAERDPGDGSAVCQDFAALQGRFGTIEMDFVLFESGLREGEVGLLTINDGLIRTRVDFCAELACFHFGVAVAVERLDFAGHIGAYLLAGSGIDRAIRLQLCGSPTHGRQSP